MKYKHSKAWDAEEGIIKFVVKRHKVIKVHQNYLPLVLALMCRDLVRIVSHTDGLIEIGPTKGSKQ